MKNLEEHIRKNRKDLDMYEPSEEMWGRINRDLGSKPASLARILSIAAILLVVLGTSLVMLRRQSVISLPRFSGNRSYDTGADPMLRETEIYYSTLMNNLYREASPLLTANPDIEKEFMADIVQLDSICADIKKDLRDNVDNQEVVEALIRNYRIRITILEEMLSTLKENENDNVKTGNDEL